MGWRLLGVPQTLLVTTELARQFAEMEPAPHDRPLSERRLQVYRKLFAEGRFRPVTWACALCIETGGVYRVNGKHTSTMLSSLGKIDKAFYATIEEYECDELEDVARLYSTFDSALQNRNAKDIYLSFASTLPELRGVPDKVVQAAITGVAYAYCDGTSDRYYRMQPTDRAELIMDHPDFVLWLDGILHGGIVIGRSKTRSMHLYRRGVVAAMFKTWQRSHLHATDFWRAVRDETGPTPTSPDRRLARLLVTCSIGGREDSRRQFAKCILAWNAWRRNRTTSMAYHEDKDIPSPV